MIELTQEQFSAVHATGTSVGVVAGAGTGKTTVLVERIKMLLASGVSPDKIFAFTFTRASGQELKFRIGEQASRMHVGTFHAIALEMFRSTPEVIDEAECESMMEQAWRMNGSRGKFNAKKIYDRYINGKASSTEIAIMHSYAGMLRLAGKEDYHGLLCSLLGRIDGDLSGYHVLVDEGQDVDWYQWQIIDAFVAHGASLFIAYDPRQSIYEWRGALYEDAEKRAVDTYHLTHSMRVPPDAAAVANRMAEIAGLPEAPLVSQKHISGCEFHGSKPVSVVVRDLIENEVYSPGEIAVLCRTNRMVDLVSKELLAEGIECKTPVSEFAKLKPILAYIGNPTSYNRKQLDSSLPLPFIDPVTCVRDSVEVLGWRCERWRDELAVKVTVKIVIDSLGLPSEYEKSAAAWKNTYGDWGLLEAVNDQAVSTVSIPSERNSVTVCTIHQSKGLEYPATVVALEMNFKPSAEDYRLMYVAATRCQERAIFCGGRWTDPICSAISTAIIKHNGVLH